MRKTAKILFLVIFSFFLFFIFFNPWLWVQMKKGTTLERDESVFFVGEIAPEMEVNLRQALENSTITQIDGAPVSERKNLYAYSFEKENISIEIQKSGVVKTVTLPVSDSYSTGGKIGIEVSHWQEASVSRAFILVRYIFYTLQFKTDYPLAPSSPSVGMLINGLSLYASIILSGVLISLNSWKKIRSEKK